MGVGFDSTIAPDARRSPGKSRFKVGTGPFDRLRANGYASFSARGEHVEPLV